MSPSLRAKDLINPDYLEYVGFNQTDIRSSLEKNEELIGKKLKVIIDRKEGEYFVGRTEFDSPEVDNEVLVKKADFFVRIGDFANVKITSADHYDLYGNVVEG